MVSPHLICSVTLIWGSQYIFLFCGLWIFPLHLCLYELYLLLDYMKIYINFTQELLWLHLFHFESLIHLEYILVSTRFLKPSRMLSVHRSNCRPYGFGASYIMKYDTLGLIITVLKKSIFSYFLPHVR